MSAARHAWALLALTAVATALLLVPAPVASAHTSVLSTSPADGETLSTAPAELVVTFTGDLLQIGTEVAVTGPDGEVDVGAVEVDADTLTAALGGDLAAGEYEVVWRVTAEDGHPVSGELGFAVGVGDAVETASAPAETSATTEPVPGQARPATLWTVVLTVVLVVLIGAAVGLWAVLRRRHRGDRAPGPHRS